MKNKNYLIIAIFFTLGLIGGLLFSTKTTKHYPILVSCYWETNTTASFPTMEADSVKGDTIYKDGLKIVNKNIKNVSFK